MKWRVGIPVLVAYVLCLFASGFCQDQTDINRGCYFDNPIRAMSDLITCADGENVCHASCGKEHKYCQSDTAMTIDYCRRLCRNRNLKYYGLEIGSQCFCGGALSDPFTYGTVEGAESNCSYPCTGDANKTCGGEYKLQIYEFKEPVENSVCFHPGFVPNSFVSEDSTFLVGGRINFICLPGHSVIGDAELVCQSGGTWSPDTLPMCNYTGVVEVIPTPVTTKTITTGESTTAKPLASIMDYLPYIIAGCAALALLVLICLICLCVRRRRERTGGTRQNIRLKPEAAPVTFVNAGFRNDDVEESKETMPDILPTSPTLYSPTTDNKRYESRLSTFSEESIYQNGEAAGATASLAPTSLSNVNEEEEPGSPVDAGPPSPLYANAEAAGPPSPLYANAEAAVKTSGAADEGYTRQHSGNNGYATTDRPNPTRGSSSDDPTFVYATTGNRRAKKNATGTKDLVGWSRPSSLYQRTSLGLRDEDEDEDEVESNEDNATVNSNDLSQAIYAQVDKSRLTNSKENLTAEHSGDSFFADPAKSSATRL